MLLSFAEINTVTQNQLREKGFHVHITGHLREMSTGTPGGTEAGTEEESYWIVFRNTFNYLSYISIKYQGNATQT